MTGWTGRILTIDLTTRRAGVITPEGSLYETCIGGKGLAGHYLMPHVTETWDSPAMPLLFFTGPLVDTPAPTSGRMTVMSRSPLTGTVCDTSVGGTLGTQIKRAGWDGVIVTGKSESPVGIEITDADCSIVDAGRLTGLEVSACRTAIGEGGATAIIGPAAENGVLFAGIAIDGHFLAGRGGLGLVMAAKGCKYLRVRGTGRTTVADDTELKAAREEIFRLTAASPILKGQFGIGEFGTGALYDLMDRRRMMPTDNFRATHFADAPAMNAWHYRERYNAKKTGCAGCHILCKKRSADGGILPEFETMSHFSALIGNHDLDTVVAVNRRCNELGMDTITAGATLACHIELSGTRPGPAQILSLIEDMGHARGAGAELARGSARYAKRHGRPGASMAVKGLELSAYDPRGAYGMALAFATSTRGACHLRAYPIAHEILRKPVATDRFSFSGKARIVKLSEDMNAAVDSLTACRFIFFAATLEEYARAYTAVTGVPATAHDLLHAGERIYYAERIMNARNGFTAADDDLPARFFEEAGTDGDGIIIAPLKRDEFLTARGAYYRVRGLDADGMPTETRCRELGLDWPALPAAGEK